GRRRPRSLLPPAERGARLLAPARRSRRLRQCRRGPTRTRPRSSAPVRCLRPMATRGRRPATPTPPATPTRYPRHHPSIPRDRGPTVPAAIRLEGCSGCSVAPCPPDGEHPRQVVPAAVRAHLDHIARHFGGPLLQLGELVLRADAATKRRQTGAEDVGNEDDV